jgi:ubiquinone/menaquinone biosynthesis C-methylase UbiE
VSKSTSRAYFDTIGTDWDHMREGFFPDRVRERALAVAAVEAGRVAADLGAGTGFLTEALLARGVRVIAVDQSPVMLDALRGKFPQGDEHAGRSPRPDLLDCCTGEAEQLPIDDSSVDYCLANMYLHHVERPAAAIREMARILVPGGIVVVTDLDAHQHTFLRDEHHDRWLGFERQDIRAWFRDAGLTDVRADDLGDECRTTSTEGSNAAISIFIASGRKP